MAKAGTGSASALKEWAKARQIETRALGPISSHILSRPLDTSRRQDVLHPSELIKDSFCPRAAYWALSGKTVTPERHSLRMVSIFDTGHATHDKYQGYFAEMGNLYGKWLIKDDTGEEFEVWAQSSEFEDLSNVKYKEVPLADDRLRIAGHSDGWVKGLGADYLIEIKSIGPGTIRMEAPNLFAGGDLFAAWKNVRAPFPSHLAQGMLYLELAHRMVKTGQFETAPYEIVFLYELKADQDVKEFVVQYDSDFCSPFLDDAYMVVTAVEDGVEPECRHGSACKMCKRYA
jgi:hypothetical protein